MKRFLLYGVSSYLTPNRLLSAALIGLTAADLTYTINTTLLGTGSVTALITAAAVMKTVTGLAFTYQTFC